MIVVETLKRSSPAPPVPQMSISGPGKRGRFDLRIDRAIDQLLHKRRDLPRGLAFRVQRSQKRLLSRASVPSESSSVTA